MVVHAWYQFSWPLLYFISQRHTTDRAYFIAKEMLMTERTYKKDLSVINVVSAKIKCFAQLNVIKIFAVLNWNFSIKTLQWFRDEVEKEDNMPTEILNTLFSLLDPIYDMHLRILRDVEQRVTTWENSLAVQQQHLGCILLSNMDLILVRIILYRSISKHVASDSVWH